MGFALIGNDLGLPYQGNGHEAHKKNGKDENDDNVRLVNRKAEDAAKPSHGKGLLVVLINLPTFGSAKLSRQLRVQRLPIRIRQSGDQGS